MSEDSGHGLYPMSAVADRRRSMARLARLKAARKAAKRRVRRKYRGPWKKTPSEGMRGHVRIQKNGATVVTKIRKKFYFETYDENGNRLGTFWARGTRLPMSAIDDYESRYGVKHPATLPIKTPQQIDRLKHKSMT